VPWYRRNHRAWGSYFLTLVTQGGYPLFRASAARRLVREAMRETLAEHTMTIHEMVLLPDHLHIQHPRRRAGLLAADPAKQNVLGG